MSDKVVTFTLSDQFIAFVRAVHKQHGIKVDTINDPIFAMDPGETTGVAEYSPVGRHIAVYQKVTKELGPSYDWLQEKLQEGCLSDPDVNGYEPWHLRYEDYRIYEWKTADHAWSQVHTLRWIGAILIAAHTTNTPHSNCLAQHAKGFWTDQKLKHFDLYPTGLRHGKDALRHLLYYMLYPTKVD